MYTIDSTISIVWCNLSYLMSYILHHCLEVGPGFTPWGIQTPRQATDTAVQVGSVIEMILVLAGNSVL